MIARLSRQSGISPQQLLALPPGLYRAVEVDVDEAWDLRHELAAAQVEWLHMIYRLLAKVLGSQEVPPLQIPRPGQTAAERPGVVKMRPGEFANFLTKRGGAKR